MPINGTDMPRTSSSSREPPRACDRCHSLKERCRWNHGLDSCDRCLRLQNVCSTRRPIRRAGRRPQVTPPASPLDNETPATTYNAYCGDHLQPVANGQIEEHKAIHMTPVKCTREEIHLIHRVLFQDDCIEKFLLGPSFWEKHRNFMLLHFHLSPDTFKDVLLACSMLWLDDLSNNASTNHMNECFSYASASLARLRSLRVTDKDGLAQCLYLGTLITTFAVKVRINDMDSIVRQTLSLAKPVYESIDLKSEESLIFLTCMVLKEITTCLMRCRLPALKIKKWDMIDVYVDPYVGLCRPFLPFLHDLCEISIALSRADQNNLGDIGNTLRTLQSAISSWQPMPPSDFSTRFTTVEIVRMLCQAQVMRTAGLLIAHRLRHPYGTEDESAHIMALSILTQLQTTYVITKSPIRWVDIAIIAALRELAESGDKEAWIAKALNWVGISDPLQQQIINIVRCAWMAMRAEDPMYWYDIDSRALSNFAENVT